MQAIREKELVETDLAKQHHWHNRPFFWWSLAKDKMQLQDTHAYRICNALKFYCAMETGKKKLDREAQPQLMVKVLYWLFLVVGLASRDKGFLLNHGWQSDLGCSHRLNPSLAVELDPGQALGSGFQSFLRDVAKDILHLSAN